LGASGVLEALDAVKSAGSVYPPPLAKFISLGRDNSGGEYRHGESFSEHLHGGKLKPTPNSVPLCWTISKYSHEELMASPCFEDHDIANQTGGRGWVHPSLLESA